MKIQSPSAEGHCRPTGGWGAANPLPARDFSRHSPIYRRKTSSSSERTSTHSSIPCLVIGRTPSRGLLDTSVVIGRDRIAASRLPDDLFVSTLTLAELSAGPAAAGDEPSRVRRRARARLAEREFQALAFDRRCVAAYGRLCGAVAAAGRKVGGSRSLDLMIAATALCHGLRFYTLNIRDFRGLGGLIEIVDLRRTQPG